MGREGKRKGKERLRRASQEGMELVTMSGRCNQGMTRKLHMPYNTSFNALSSLKSDGRFDSVSPSTSVHHQTHHHHDASANNRSAFS